MSPKEQARPQRGKASPEGQGAVHRAFGKVATKASQWTGSAFAFGLALSVIAAWALTGPLFGFSDTWQLVINTSTTIVTFLMVFLLQHAQAKDTRALHLKLDELVAAQRGASNELIDVEDLTDEELEALHQRFIRLAGEAKQARQGASLSVDREAEDEGDAAAQDVRATAGRRDRGGRGRPQA